MTETIKLQYQEWGSYNSPQYAGNAIAVITNLDVTFKFGE